MSRVLYQPDRGHYCKEQSRWVTADENPYEVDEALAQRYVRARLGTILTPNVEEDAPTAERGGS